MPIHTSPYIYLLGPNTGWCELAKQSQSRKTESSRPTNGLLCRISFYSYTSIRGMCVHWGNYTQHSQEVQYFCKPNSFIVVANILFFWCFLGGNWTIMEKYSCLRWILIQLSDQGFLFREPSDYPSIEIVKQPTGRLNTSNEKWNCCEIHKNTLNGWDEMGDSFTIMGGYENNTQVLFFAAGRI